MANSDQFGRTRKAQQPTPVTSTQEVSSQKSPAKQRASKTKSKTAVKDAPKANAKPIYSFFNSATQRQQLSQPSATPEKPVSQEQPEAIQDESGDEGTSVAFSKGSSTALTVRKRKQHNASLVEEPQLLPSATQKFRKTSDGGRTPSFGVANEDKRPWTEQFAPVDLSELAVHKRKVGDVREWLEAAVNGKRQKVLVLKGVAGTGKTATIALLAKDLGLDVSAWHNPAGAEMAPEGSLSAGSQFEDFIGRAGRSHGLTFVTGDVTGQTQIQSKKDDDGGGSIEQRRQILLIEEFPNTFSRTSSTLQAFRSAILQYVSSPPVGEASATPVVMIISETLLSTNTAAADSFTAHRLLGPELVNHPYVNMIEFNAVAPTILTKALETIVVKEARKSGRRKTPGPQVLKRLAETGDIRSAVSSLEFLCLRGDDGDVWSSKVQFTKPKKKSDPAMTKAEEEALMLISNRESSLGVFHAVGRVVNNKRMDPAPGHAVPPPPPWLPQHRRAKVVERDVDPLIDELGTDVLTYVAALHENYALSCGSSSGEDTMDSLSGCADSISDADLLSTDRFSFGTRAFSGSAMDGLRQDEMSFHVAVRGLLFNLPSPVHRAAPPGRGKGDAFRMFYPTSLKLWKAKEEIEGTLDWLTARAQNGKLVSDESAPRAKAAAGGVEAWKRPSDRDTTHESFTADDSELVQSTLTKYEMLVERLPYLAQILTVRHKTRGPSAVLDQILSVSQMSRQTVVNADDDDASAEDGPETNGPTELWTTDKPDTDPKVHTPRPKALSKGKQKFETEGGGLAIPVEASVEKLVLEDDDIVDD